MPPRRPNVLFLLTDQMRFDWLQSNPLLPVRTPHLSELARCGAAFSRAVTPSPLCAPARACLAAGREYDRCGVRDNRDDYPLDQPTYYGLLRDVAGYHVIGTGKFDLHKASYIWGVAGKERLADWGFSDGIDNAGKIDAVRSGAESPQDPYMAYLHAHGLAGAHVADLNSRKSYAATHPTPLPDDAYCDNWLAQNALDLLKAAPADRPWHLVVNFAGPHNPMDVTQAMHEWYQGVDFPQPHASSAERDWAQSRNYPAPDQHVQIRRNYSAMVENIDRWVGIFVAELARRGELEHTVIVFSSDHGDMLGDHALWAKTQPYQPSIGVPLIVAGPGVREGVQCDAPVSLIDLAPTFLDWAGVAVPPEMDGRSLAGMLAGERDAPRSVVRSALGAWRLAFDGRFKLVAGYRHPSEPEGTDAALRLFDLARDPQETLDVAALRPDVVERLRPYL